MPEKELQQKDSIEKENTTQDVLLFVLEGPVGQYVASQLSDSMVTGSFRATVQRDPDAYTYVVFEVCEDETFPWEELSQEVWGDVWPSPQNESRLLEKEDQRRVSPEERQILQRAGYKVRPAGVGWKVLNREGYSIIQGLARTEDEGWEACQRDRLLRKDARLLL